jgi:hypothetical protein
MNNETPLLLIHYRKAAQAKGRYPHQDHHPDQKGQSKPVIAFMGGFWYYFAHNCNIAYGT